MFWRRVTTHVYSCSDSSFRTACRCTGTGSTQRTAYSLLVERGIKHRTGTGVHQRCYCVEGRAPAACRSSSQWSGVTVWQHYSVPAACRSSSRWSGVTVWQHYSVPAACRSSSQWSGAAPWPAAACARSTPGRRRRRVRSRDWVG
jgi:hypothetical protein